MKVRKLAIALALAGGVTSNVAYAVGMGEARVTSHLNEPLRAEIQLTRPGEFTEEDIRAALASPENFERAGVQKEPILRQLDMDVVRNDDGDLVIQVTSDRPMREPFLNFLVEVIWPNGRVMREYAFLIDPPDYREPPTAERPGRPEVERDPAPAAPDAPTQERPVAEQETPSEYGPVSANENLWNIAGDVRPAGDLSREQVMMALYEENPHAFMGNNINRLRRDVVLRVPPESQMRGMSADEANQAVAQHHQAFAEGRQVADTETDVVEEMATADQEAVTSDEAVLADDDELRLMVDDTGTAEGEDGSPGGVGDGDGSTELALALEELDRAQRERREMSERLESLEEQINTMEELIRLRDDQLAEMQARLGEEPARETDEPEVADEDDEVAAAPADDIAEEDEPAPAEEEPQVAAEDPASDEDEAFVAALLNELRTNPSYQIGAGALGVGLLALMLAVARRRKGDEPELGTEFGEEDGEILDLGDGPDSSPERDVQPQGEDETLAEASVYLAYGRLDQAEEHLDGAIEAQPERIDLRMKMLEVQAEKGDEESFARHRAEVERLGGDDALRQVRELESRMQPGSGATDDDLSIDDLENELKSMEEDAPQDSEEQDEDFNFNWDEEDLGELDLGPEDEQGAPKADEASDSTRGSEPDDALDFGDLDDSIDIEESSPETAETSDVTEESEADSANASEEESIDFELDEDFDLAAASASGDSDTDDESQETAEQPAEQAEQGAESFEFSTDNTENAEPETAVEPSDDDKSSDGDFDDSFLAELDAELDKVTGDEGHGDSSDDDSDLDDLELDISDDDLALIDDVAGEPESKPEADEPMLDESELEETTDDSAESDDESVPTAAEEPASQDEDTSAEEGDSRESSLEMAPEGLDEEVLPELTPEEENALRDEEAADGPEDGDQTDAADSNDSEPPSEEAVTEASPEDEADFEDFDSDDDFDFLEGTDESGTKLDLARAYVEMGDAEGAREILEEVVAEGNDEQKQEANKLLKDL